MPPVSISDWICGTEYEGLWQELWICTFIIGRGFCAFARFWNTEFCRDKSHLPEVLNVAIAIYGKRVDHWREHLTETIDLSAPPPLTPSQTIGKKIELLWKHLDVIDNKIGRLLAILGLFSLVSVLKNSPTPEDVYSCRWWLLLLFTVFWSVSALFCLWGIKRVVWGGIWVGSKGQQRTSQKAEETMEDLTREVVDRTAKFRVAVLFLSLSIIVLIVLLLTGLFHPVHPDPHCPCPPTPPPPPAADTWLPFATIPDFPSGVSCPDLPIRPAVAGAIESIKQRHLQKLYLVGGADGVPLGPSLRGLYSSNKDLALSRARCVAGWIGASLGSPIQVRIDSDPSGSGQLTVDNKSLRRVEVKIPAVSP